MPTPFPNYMKDNKLIVIDYMRFVAILSIVTWHCCICPYLCWNLVDIETLPINYPFRVVAMVFFPDATMPLFTFISGYLFSYLLGQGKYKEFRPFVINKLHRLIIPFLVIGTLVNLTSYDRFMEDIPWGEGSHLWYCCMLFWCFIITWAVVKYAQRYGLYLMFAVSLLLEVYVRNHFDMGFKLPFGIHQSIYYIGYFICGYLLFQNQEYLGLLNRHKYALLISYVLACIIALMNVPLVSKVFVIAHNYIYSILLLVILGKFKLKKPVFSSIVARVCKYSFGIYVFHEWISWNFCNHPPVTLVLREHYVLFPLFNTVIIFILSYCLTGISLRTKVGRYLLL